MIPDPTFITAVEARLARCFDDVRQPATTASLPALFEATPQEDMLLEAVRDLTFRGGKRLRAQLVHIGAALFDPVAASHGATVDVAAAVELLQTYFLIHDDIMDGDETRRGGPSVHVALGARCQSDAMGMQQAILAGDLACALQESLMAGLDIADAQRRTRVTALFAHMHRTVIRGQSLDLLGTAPPETIVRLKTASYTTEGPLLLGALLADAPASALVPVRDIASALGIAFQYRDDLLSLFGAPEKTGKPTGSDLRAGKKTHLVAMAWERADTATRAFIDAHLGAAHLSDNDIATFFDIFRHTGAIAAVESAIAHHTDRALQVLSRMSVSPVGKSALRALAIQMAQRDA
ncbi:MAG: polyprenyl synthetase family protein [Myxococcales bacterium]|jgi:geranylgeranyl diphosphate synthase type I|nr:polyprenyl synthetase family protein [Myxococcales bacterium]